MPSQSDIDDFLQGLPDNFYATLAPGISLCGMGCLQLFARPQDAAAQEVTALTGLDTARVQHISALQSNEALGRMLVEEPEQLYDFLLVGQLCLESPLARPVMAFLQHQMQIPYEQVETVRDHAATISTSFMSSLKEHLEARGDQAAESLALRRLQLEGIFARHSADLEAAVQPTAAGASQPAAVVMQVSLNAPQLEMLRLAASLPALLPAVFEHPFAQALTQVASFGEENLEAVRAGLREMPVNTPVGLTMQQVLVLYQAVQVCGLVFVSDQFVELLAPLLTGDPNPGSSDIPAPSPEEAEATFRQLRDGVCAMAGGFAGLVSELFANDAQVAAARQEIEALADLL
ncbi:hypothetical protein LJY25_18475 [Hymenobacter sp. BT175]|uniref:hypothetical protein n=1 Tax=Hymenobacter translucens TaxID=2886507 RepID=UPI001D0EDBB1|nr:hypothetical protein [Hymenobacter translucens]MCC2548439.1 hypothetical protein [Hymenobacter translucens]